MITDPVHAQVGAKLKEAAAQRTLTSVEGAFEHQLSQVSSRVDTRAAQRSSDRPAADRENSADVEPSESREDGAVDLEKVDDSQRSADQETELDTSAQQDDDPVDAFGQEDEDLSDQVTDPNAQSSAAGEQAAQGDQLQALAAALSAAQPVAAANVNPGDVAQQGRQPAAEQQGQQSTAAHAPAASTQSVEIVPLVPADESQTSDSGQTFSQQSTSGGQSSAVTLQAAQSAPQFDVATTNAPLSATANVGAAQPDPQAAPPQAANLPAPPPSLGGEDQANVARVVRGLVNAVNQNGGSVTLRLQPPELGFVRVQLEINDGSVRAAFQAEQPAVRTLLSQQMSQLRQALQSHGLQVDRLDVQTMQSEDNSTNTESNSDDVADDGRSRGSFEDANRQDDADGQSPQGSTQQDEPASFEQTLNAVA